LFNSQQFFIFLGITTSTKITPNQGSFYGALTLLESGSYTSPCRCSGEYIISEDELELGVDTVVCSTCSLIVRIHYEAAEDEDEDEDTN
jgi:diphthamide biosynthesis protein 4